MPFPLAFIPKLDWKTPPRCFGARRSGGRRKHAGCDLYAPIGTPVFAVTDGKVLGFAPFYLGTYALTVDHGAFTVRYGEIEQVLPVGIKPGRSLKAGDRIGTVGRLSGLAISMVHFEMYSGSAKGALTQPRNAPFMRRADLIDPAAALDGWAQELRKQELKKRVIRRKQSRLAALPVRPAGMARS